MILDLRESGAMDQDADVVLLLYRRAPYLRHKGKPEYRKLPDGMSYEEAMAQCEVIVAKQRNGPTGTVLLDFNETTQRFQDWADYKERVMAIGS